MAATAKLVTPPATEPPTALHQLHADRAGLTRELTALTASATKLREAGAGEAAAQSQLDELGRTEIAAMVAWASNGCRGEAPKADQQTRIRLGQQLNAAQLAAAAAKGAGADIDQKIADLNSRLQAIGRQIEEISLDTMETEHGNIIARYRENCEHGAKLAAAIHGLASFFGDTGRNLISRGEQQAGTAYLQRASALTNLKLPSPGVTRHEIEAAAHEWGRRAATLRAGT